MRVALLGFGNLGEARARAYSEVEEAELVAILDPTELRRRHGESLLPGVPLYAELETLLREAQPEAVDICSPPVYHEEQIRLSLTHGCHVLCEKPLVTRAGALTKLAEQARSAGKVLYPAHNYRFSPAMHFFADTLRSGSLGTLRHGHFQIVRTSHARGVTEWHPDWRRDPAIAGGGILSDHGTHCVYMASRLSEEWPRAVSCTIDLNGGSEETVRLELETGPVSWTVELTWTGESRRNYYELSGSLGSAVVDDDRGYLRQNGSTTTWALPSALSDSTHRAWFPAMFAEFRHAISDRECAEDVLAEGVATVSTLEHGYASAKELGEWLQIDLPAICRGRAAPALMHEPSTNGFPHGSTPKAADVE
jgi:predicted dehydrogenase